MALPDNTPNMQPFQAARAQSWVTPQFMLSIVSSVLSGVVSMVVAFELLKSDQRIDHEAISRIESEVKEIHSGLPNTGAYDIKIHELEVQIASLQSDLKAEDFLVQSIKTDVKIALREIERRR